MVKSRVTNHIRFNSLLHHLLQPSDRTLEVTLSDMSTNHAIVRDLVGREPARHQVLVPSVGCCTVTTLGTRLYEHVQANQVWLQPSAQHYLHPIFSSCWITSFCTSVHHGPKGEPVWSAAMQFFLHEPLLSLLNFSHPCACGDQVAECLLIRIQVGGPHACKPIRCPGGSSSSGARIDERVEDHKVWLHACLDHSFKPFLAKVQLAQLGTCVHHCAERNHAWLDP
mmetsp:Transcript_41899/g.96122  ORF Transcript_41899/g.96122 Transcript_41899/m.96122 type:complete len:225 (+) Transcript_41899:684-1358(+)